MLRPVVWMKKWGSTVYVHDNIKMSIQTTGTFSYPITEGRFYNKPLTIENGTHATVTVSATDVIGATDDDAQKTHVTLQGYATSGLPSCCQVMTDDGKKDDGMNVGLILGIVFGSILGAVVLVVTCVCCGCC